jgi:tripartite-type tricarboxylate transporter receptor subunit TctC
MDKAFSDPEYQKYLSDNNLMPFHLNRSDFKQFLGEFVETAAESFKSIQQ